MLVAGTNCIPAMIPKVVKLAFDVITLVVAVVFVIPMTACALAILSGLPMGISYFGFQPICSKILHKNTFISDIDASLQLYYISDDMSIYTEN